MRPVPLLLIAIPVLFLALGANSIWDANEAFYVETPRQMVVTGDYVNPTFNAQPRFNKPVLSYWVVAGFYKVFGVSVGVERFGIALGAVGILIGALLIGRALRSPGTGALGALLVVTAPRLIFIFRRIFIDVWLTTFMTLGLACFVLAERDPQHRRRYLLLMYVSLGLGVLTKGPIALAIPAIACLGWLIAERRLSDLRRLMLPTGTLIVLAISLPWYLAIYAQHGWEYIRFFFVDENLGRFATPLTTERGPAFFVAALFADLLMPWAPLLAIPMMAAWRRTPSADAAGGIRRLLWWWVATTLAIFSFSASKEDLYVLPAIPAAAALIADRLMASGFGATDRIVRWILVAVALLSVAMAVLVATFFTAGHYALAGAWLLAVVLAGAGVSAVVAILRHRHAAGAFALVVGFILFNYLFVLRTLPDVERLKPGPALARVLAERASPAAQLASFNIELPSLVYYAGRPVASVSEVDQAVRFMADHRDAWMLAGESDWTELHRLVPASCVAARQPLFLAKGSDIIRGQPPPDVVLITNNCR